MGGDSGGESLESDLVKAGDKNAGEPAGSGSLSDGRKAGPRYYADQERRRGRGVLESRQDPPGHLPLAVPTAWHDDARLRCSRRAEQQSDNLDWSAGAVHDTRPDFVDAENSQTQ